MTKNPKLYHLDCRENYLTKMTVKYCALTYLCCAGNSLTALDVSTQTLLESLECPMNKIASLNLSSNTELTTLECGNNQIESLDLTKCTKLQFLYCYQNKLTSLNISNCKKLTSFVCHGNNLQRVDISDIPGLYETCWFGTRSENTETVEFYPADTSNYDIAVYDLSTEIISMKAPTLSAENTASGIKLTWTDSEGAADYEIERFGTDALFGLLARRISGPYTDKEAAPFDYCRYRVRARVDGTYSDYSNEIICIRNPFTDVSESASYFEAVMWTARHGFVSGTTKTTFSPNAPCTRYQFAVMLYKFAGKPDIGSVKLPFTDVPKTASYYKAVAWAYTTGIIKGTTKTTFSPDDTITRYQAVQMLYKFKGKPDIGTVTNPFSDVKSSDSYYSAVMWACENGITKGTSSTTFSPKASCRRYQLVVFLYKVFQRYAEG
ncbi:MAG: S-layer homology domain-containing protein [Lachnospiraceae bacterium]|nr:S-layer homology domain-containing protein [Lachnospiraceae bacterium]